MIKECNFKNKVQDGYQCSLSSLLYETDSLTNGGVQHAKECDGEDNCVLYQIYDKLDTILIAKEHSKTMEGLAKK